MNKTGFTVSPVITENAEGQEVITDFSFDTGRSSVGRDGRVLGWQDDYIEDSEGRIHHVMEDTFLEDESTIKSFDFDEYAEDLLESNPKLQDAVIWAGNNMHPSFIEEWDSIIQKGEDLGRINEMMEQLMVEYDSRVDAENVSEQPATDDEIQEEIDELSPEQIETLNLAIEDLTSQDMLGDEAADEWESLSKEALQSDKATLAMVAAATSAFHRGSMSAEDAIDAVLSKCPLDEVAEVYEYLSNQ